LETDLGAVLLHHHTESLPPLVPPAASPPAASLAVDDGRLRQFASMLGRMPLPRFQLFELEDLPGSRRQFGTSPPIPCTSLRDGWTCKSRWSRCCAVPSKN
jgi:hypothetical protein